MARTVLPFVGAAVGFWIGGPTGAQVGFALGGVVGNAVDPVKNIGPRIGETGAQTSAEGAPRAIVYGTAPVTGNVIFSGALVKGDFEEGGGKGGPVNVTERCFRTYAIRICEGVIQGVLRIWENDKLVADFRPQSLIVAETANWMFGCGIYYGDESQLPDSFLLADPAGGENPAYRGSAYMVFVFRDLTDFRGAIPQYRFEVTTTGTTEPLDKVDDSPFENGNQAGGSIAPLQVYPPVITNIEGPGRENVMLISYESDGNPDVLYRITIVVDGVPVLDDEPTLVTQFVQINTNSDAEVVTVTLYATNLVSNSEIFHISFNQIAPDATELDGEFHAYNGGSVAPTAMLPDDDYYGVLSDDTGLKAASWGPDSIQVVGGPTVLSNIVADIHSRCDVTGYDVSELDDEVAGLVLAGEYTGADAINTLRGPYFFDKAEYDQKLWYPKRGAAVVDTLTIDNLVDEPDQQMREQAIEYPKKFHLFYQHANSGYAVVKATSMRSSPDVRVVGEVTAQVPVVFVGAENEAAQTAQKMHKVSWAEAEGDVKFSVPWSFLALVPSSNIGLFLRGRVSRLRLTQLDLHDGVIDITARHDRQSAYTSDVTGIPIPNPTPPPSTIVGDTALIVLDIPSLRDTEDDLNIYYAAVGTQPGWYGAVVQQSRDSGATWTNVATISRPAVAGELTASLADADANTTDTTNTVSVRLMREDQTLESITNAQFLSEAGAIAIENGDSSWEILQVRDWTQDSGGVFHGTTLHRGRLNTTTNAHTVGQKLVLLETATHVPMQSSMIGQTVSHRAPSLGQSPELATETDEVYVGRSQIEWEPASLMLSRVGDIVAAYWAPRYRFGTDDAPVNSINMTGFRVTITGTGTITFDTTSNTFSQDVSSIGGGVTVSVQALNRITGAGPATSGTI